MNYLDRTLRKIVAFTEAERLLLNGGGPVVLSGTTESQRAHILSRAGSFHARLVVVHSESEARRISEDLRFFSDRVLMFPEKDLLFYQADIRSLDLLRQRMRALRAIREGGDYMIVTTFAAMMNVLPPCEEFDAAVLDLSEGLFCEQEAVVKKLISLGYERTARVEAPGEFAVHGGILDVFDITEERPVRVEFWDTEIDTIRSFNPETQISEERRESVSIYPAEELFPGPDACIRAEKSLRADYEKLKESFVKNNQYEEAASLQSAYREASDGLSDRYFRGRLAGLSAYFYEEQDSLLSYLPKETLLCLLEPARLLEQGTAAEEEFSESFRMRIGKGLAFPKEGSVIRSVQETFEGLDTGRTLALTGFDSRPPMLHIQESYLMEVQPTVSYQGNFEGLTTDLKNYLSRGFSVVLLSPSRTRASRMAEQLREYGIKAYFDEDPEREVEPGTMLVAFGHLHRGFSYPQLKFILLTEGDVLGSQQKKKHKPRFEGGQKIRNFSELSAGDYVVHENYGIGIYQGIESLRSDDVERDYMRISYGDSGTLYVPVTNLEVVQKYASADAKMPRLSRLDSPDWKRTRTRVKTAVTEVAEELVELYALRQNGEGFHYAKDTIWQSEFEEMFPYEETDDQLQAIAAVKEDMESGKIMDRLLCGDVGFGKTEVALRAAFKAVQDSKQVAYLVPTTILAQQHYNTFVQRLANFPVRVELLSRFRTAEQQKESVRLLRRGEADIVIGTHRILSKDVEFKDLGLLIIDEEQRFGVKHKEQIKQLKKNVDVLSLTATPIPRTLHMSMIGVRDMSVITEAPTDRVAIQTYVMEYAEELVREAIQRELSRGGQVYYVYNRVQDIADIAAKIQALVPDAVVAYAHGKMSERELERRMLSFIEGEIDVLVSTTIIETGLDIPNVNTIIVHDAERYGLAQLYQLRGRVGRSNRQAYAFIMYRKNRVMTEEAQKRLEAIRQFTELGSGIKIAMQDLQIRGAGAVLGSAQSGHMTEVGYDLYCKMLAQAVKKARGLPQDTADFDTLLDIREDAYIPSSYIGNESLKLEIYKRISLIQTEEDRQELSDELLDRFGEPPLAVQKLLRVSTLKNMARSIYISEVKGNEMELTFRFVPYARVKTENIPVLIANMKGEMRFLPGETPGLQWHRLNLAGKKESVLDVLQRLLSEIKELLI